ncbi:hypothetical protein PIB30_053809 [Stylosanthes scabra]|uniref:Uncharacterized protein n=1 Tax=Stylosanthes scabra TaxID=79078 RepID=A0ABU6QJH2_9FABA|nr:hypothetical protein [Stylosanthes scabra]
MWRRRGGRNKSDGEVSTADFEGGINLREWVEPRTEREESQTQKDDDEALGDDNGCTGEIRWRLEQKGKGERESLKRLLWMKKKRRWQRKQLHGGSGNGQRRG